MAEQTAQIGNIAVEDVAGNKGSLGFREWEWTPGSGIVQVAWGEMGMKVRDGVSEHLEVHLCRPVLLLDRSRDPEDFAPVAGRLTFREFGGFGCLPTPPDDDGVPALHVGPLQIGVTELSGKDAYAETISFRATRVHIGQSRPFTRSDQSTGQVWLIDPLQDIALALGRALRHTLGDLPVARSAHAVVAMDDALVMAALDLSGRPYLAADLEAGSAEEHFLRSLTSEAGMTLHVLVLRGKDGHHIAEAAFKALGLALRDAARLTEMGRSTKGFVEWRVE
jgi:imidazoleglycerol-phosphate dehydratase